MQKTGEDERTVTPERASQIAWNLAGVRSRISEAAAKVARDSATITLLGVTKYASNAETAALINLGVTDLGESRVQDAEKKIGAISNAHLRWHLIGHLQTNKAKQAVKLFGIVHSIDSIRVAVELDKEAGKLRPDARIDGLIEINAAREANKFGLPPEKEPLFELLKRCSELSSLRIVGLMGMAPYAEDPEPVSRPVFKRLREMLDEANGAGVYPQRLTQLSMGMTQDFQIAIEEGATLVRVGSALFE